MVASVESGAGGGVRPSCNRAAVKRIHPSGRGTGRGRQCKRSGLLAVRPAAALCPKVRGHVSLPKVHVQPGEEVWKVNSQSCGVQTDRQLTFLQPPPLLLLSHLQKRRVALVPPLNPNTALLLLFCFDNCRLFVLVRCTFLSAAAV